MSGKKQARSAKKARRAKTEKQPATRVRARAPIGEKSTARRGGPERKQGTIKEDRRTPADAAPQKNLRKDHNKASYELETTDTSKRPSRKSTRRGANRIKPDSQLRRRATRAVRSPKNRHAMRAA